MRVWKGTRLPDYAPGALAECLGKLWSAVYSQHMSWAHLETERKGPAKVQEAGVSRVLQRDLVSIGTPGICTNVHEKGAKSHGVLSPP